MPMQKKIVPQKKVSKNFFTQQKKDEIATYIIEYNEPSDTNLTALLESIYMATYDYDIQELNEILMLCTKIPTKYYSKTIFFKMIRAGLSAKKSPVAVKTSKFAQKGELEEYANQIAEAIINGIQHEDLLDCTVTASNKLKTQLRGNKDINDYRQLIIDTVCSMSSLVATKSSKKKIKNCK